MNFGEFLKMGAQTGLAAALGAFVVSAAPQTVDCVVAEVDGRAITLTDIRIFQAFSIGRADSAASPAVSLRDILDKAIDRKVIANLVRENVPVSKEEVDDRLKELTSRFNPAEYQRLLETFGLTADDLRPYLEEVLQYEKMVAIRFSQSVDVSIREIETYYSEVYVPAQKARGEEPRPMVQVLSELEARLKNQKTETQVSAWVRSLRAQAEVKVYDQCLGQFK
jgi:DNA polymerase III gamma/tau subunit